MHYAQHEWIKIPIKHYLRTIFSRIYTLGKCAFIIMGVIASGWHNVNEEIRLDYLFLKILSKDEKLFKITDAQNYLKLRCTILYKF